MRLYSDFFYKAGTWPHPRRVVVKCEVTALGTNVRFVVTNRVGSAEQIFGSIDAQKLRSSATLFALADPTTQVFQRVLDQYFDGVADPATEALV